MNTETLTDVPATDLETVTAEFVAAGSYVVAIRQQDGRWTVVASYTTPQMVQPG